MVHLSFVERVGLLPGASIAVPIFNFWAFIGIMSILPALVTSDMAEIPLGGCGRCRAVLVSIGSIPISIAVLGAIVIVRATSSMGMLKLSYRCRGKTGLLLSSRVILSLPILPLTTFNLLMLPFNH